MEGRRFYLELFDRFSPDKVNIESLKHSMSRGQYITERRIVEIKEIADSAADFVKAGVMGGIDIATLLSLAFKDGVLPPITLNADTMPESVDSVSSYSDAVAANDGAELAALLISALAERGITVGEEDFLKEELRDETIAYVKNPFADEAYDVFSTELSDPRVSYVRSFKDALNMLDAGEAGYCLLPLEERGARLSTIGEMIFRGDFKINSVTPVFGFDGLADMKYALVSKSFTVPPIDEDDDRYLEIRIAARECDISDILLAARRYNVALYRINSSIYDIEGNNELYYSIVFKEDGSDFTELLAYLTLFFGDYTPVGIYKNLE